MGVLLGGVVTGTAAWVGMPKMMLKTLRSHLPVDETVDHIVKAAPAEGWQVPKVYDLLWTYAVGHCLLILVAGTSMGVAKHLIQSRGLGRANVLLKRTAGVLIALVGAFILWNGA